jgi:polysaccharide biosynthesis protein PslH
VKEKPWILLISHVWPVPGTSGQEMRVFYMLKALRVEYKVLFLTYGSEQKKIDSEEALKGLCDELIVLSSVYNASVLNKIMLKAAGGIYSRFTGLKFSNFIIPWFELSAKRVTKVLKDKVFSAVVFEYWHAHPLTDIFKEKNIPVVLDMHNILWQTYKVQNVEQRIKSEASFFKYKSHEEQVWLKFDRLITINRVEHSYVQTKIGKKKVWYIPMGTDLNQWPALLKSQNEVPQLAYYGGLGRAHNQKDALSVYYNVMPEIWAKWPNSVLWIIGSKPPQTILDIGKKDARVNVTGFIDDVASVLGKMDLVLCPWEGTYGFRSRIVEIMATGTPVVTTNDAVNGMDLENAKGLFLSDNLSDWPALVDELLKSEDLITSMRVDARRQIEDNYSMDATYFKLPELIDSILNKENRV